MRHKDSYIHDKNNEIHGTSLRKLSLIIFLNDNLKQGEKGGMLRLYPKGNSVEKVKDISPQLASAVMRQYPKGNSVEEVVDISPRLGRAVMFKSEEMLH